MINPNYIEGYLDGSSIAYTDGKISGCIKTVDDAAGMNTPSQIYDGLRLDYDGTPFSPTDESVTVIRFTSEKTSSDLKIPYGDSMPNPTGGYVSEMTPPFTGNEFTSATNGQIIPEYYSDGLVLKDGAQKIEITNDGQEILKAVYDADRKKFTLLP